MVKVDSSQIWSLMCADEHSCNNGVDIGGDACPDISDDSETFGPRLLLHHLPGRDHGAQAGEYKHLLAEQQKTGGNYHEIPGDAFGPDFFYRNWYFQAHDQLIKLSDKTGLNPMNSYDEEMIAYNQANDEVRCQKRVLSNATS